MRGNEAADLAQRFDALEKLVLNLQGAASGGKGGSGKGGFRGASPHRGAGGGKPSGGGGGKGEARGSGGKDASRGRPGDWSCGACGAYPCFGRTSRCYRCGASKSGGGKGHGQGNNGTRAGSSLTRELSRGTFLGPLGAGGSRPMLGGRGCQSGSGADERRPAGDCPSFRTPGASLAAQVEAGRRARQDDRRAEPGGAKQADHDGFQPARGGASAWRAAQGSSAPMVHHPPTPQFTSSTSWAVLAEEEEDEEQCDDDSMGNEGDGESPAGAQEDPPGPLAHDHHQHEDAGDDGDDGDGNLASGSTDEGTLKREWLAHVAACRLLERDGGAPLQLVTEARAQRDAAERRWRAAKTPHPLHKRLRWAEAELREAEAKEIAHRGELETHLAQAEKRTQELEERLRTDVARTARKRAAVESLHREGAHGQPRAAAERAAIAAATGISKDVAPALLSAIEKLGTPGNAEQEATWKELQLAAVSLSRVEEVLREGVQRTPPTDGPAVYHIGGDEDDGASQRGKGPQELSGGERGTTGTDNNGKGRPPAAATVPRWTKPSSSGPWQRITTSTEAVEEARRKLRRCTDTGGGKAVAEDGVSAGQCGATTNDLAEAERRDREAAQRQLQESLRTQGHEKDAAQLQLDEQMRQQREQRRIEELHRHQAEAQKAAEARAAEEEQQRKQLVASMSPEQLALAAEVHAQQLAIGTKVFGTEEAAHLAGLAHQAHVQRTLQDAEGRGRTADADDLMAMSPEDFAQWNRDCQEDW